MRNVNDLFLRAVEEETVRLSSRRGVLGGAAKLVGGGALALVAAGPIAAGLGTAQAQGSGFGSDVAILNYALTLEHLENAFYRQGIQKFGTFLDYIQDVAAHERVHVNYLTATIRKLGGTPVQPAEYNFTAAFRSRTTFLATAAALENVGVTAYDGAIGSINSAALQTAAATIATVEARHASYLNFVNGDNPFPKPFDTAASKATVLRQAGKFIVG